MIRGQHRSCTAIQEGGGCPQLSLTFPKRATRALVPSLNIMFLQHIFLDERDNRPIVLQVLLMMAAMPEIM